MKPVKSNITQTSEACTPVSSNCVIWQGPDIPCLSLCSGDSVTEVVYKLGTLFCQIVDSAFDVANIDLTCLLEDGDTAPATRDEFYQFLVDKICLALQPVTPVTPEEHVFNLPACLQYTDGDGNIVTTLTTNAYIDHIAAAICDIWAAIDAVNVDIDSLDVRVTALESVVPPTPSFTTVTTQCASGPTPGMTLPITQAFYNLESKFCILSQVLGTIPALNDVIATECANLDTATSLMDSEVQMQDIPGWVATPSTVAENLNNLWLTICDMRSKIIDCCAAPVIPCAPIAVTGLTVSSITTTGAMASWSVPAFGTGEAPIEYQVRVFALSAGSPTGGAIITQTVLHPTTFVNLNTAALVEDRLYAVQVTAIYNCGESTVAQVVSILRAATASLCINVYETNLTSTTTTCASAIYPVLNKRTYARLQNTVGGTPVVNTATAISVAVNYDLTDECGVTSTVSATIVIPNGSSEGYIDYVHQTKRYCSSIGACGTVTRIISCVDSIGGTTVPLCSGDVVMCSAL